MIIDGRPYAPANVYSENVPAGAPASGEPGPQYEPYLEQRSNHGYAVYSNLPDGTGKTVVAHSSQNNSLIILTQPHGSSGQSMDSIRDSLHSQNVDNAIILDGSDSAAMNAGGNNHSVATGQFGYKNEAQPTGVGFSQPKS